MKKCAGCGHLVADVINVCGVCGSEQFNPLEKEHFEYKSTDTANNGKVSFKEALKLFFKNYTVFSGRASKREFWLMFPFHGLAWISLILSYLGGVLKLISIVLDIAFTMPGVLSPEISAGERMTLVTALLLEILWIVILAIIPNVVSWLFLLPSLALTVRRLHDTGNSAKHVFGLSLIPAAGPMILWDELLRKSDGDNQWGPAA